MYKVKGDTSKIKEKCNTGSIVFHRSSEANDTFLGNINVYVRMIKNGNNDYYYISMTDGKYGYSEILESELTIEKIIEYDKLEIDLQNSDFCNYEKRSVWDLKNKEVCIIISTGRWLELIIRTFNFREFVVGENDIKYLFIYSIDEFNKLRLMPLSN